MGLHPSLKRAQSLAATRTVLKRTERLKWLLAREKWQEGDKVTGLPKIKQVKVKAAKKTRKEEEKPKADAAKK